MALFENYPKIAYGGRLMTDLSVRVVFRKTIKDNKNLYFKYDIEDQSTPEDVAYNHYGDANLHWTILAMNDIIDPFYDWVLSRRELERYVIGKYGKPSIVNGKYHGDGFNAIHHWELNGVYYYHSPSSNNPNKAPALSIPITLREYEEQLNDAKRTIKVIYPEYIDNVTRELQYLIENGF